MNIAPLIGIGAVSAVTTTAVGLGSHALFRGENEAVAHNIDAAFIGGGALFGAGTGMFGSTSGAAAGVGILLGGAMSNLLGRGFID